MDDSDFTTTGTGTVTLATAANLNDVINIVSFETNIPDSNYVPASGGTFTGDVDFGSNKITYANLYNDLSDLPSASTYHGMFAHVHNTGLGYYSHAGAWIPLANLTGATFSGDVTATKLVSSNGVLELDDNGSHNGIINSPASLRVNIDSDNGGTGETFTVGTNQTAIDNNNVLFRVDDSGHVTKPLQPCFMVIMTSAPTLTGTAVTTLPWNSEIFDVGNNFNTSNYTFTAPVAGKYFMHLHLEFHSDSSWTNSTWSYVGDWYVNGVQKTGADFWGHSGRYNICPNTAILDLGANDNVNVRARPNNNTLRYSGDSANAFSNCKWMGYLLQ